VTDDPTRKGASAQDLTEDGKATVSRGDEAFHDPFSLSAENPVMFGPYRMLREIARGAMGIVYLGHDTRLDREVAIKILKQGDRPSKAEIERFLREARTSAQLRHPHIVSVHDVGVLDGNHYFTMDYVEGRSLHELLSSNQIDQGHALRILEQVALAVHHAHTERVVHRDIKPSNILVDESGKGLIMDFGLARQMERAGGEDGPLLTQAGRPIGTPHYMPPEQVLGELERINATSDVYSLGVILYEILTRKTPFIGMSNVKIYQSILTKEPAAPRKLRRGVARDLETICAKAMEKVQRARYQSAAEFAEDLERQRKGEFILARPPSIWRRIKRVARHQRLPLAVATVAAVLLLVFQLISARDEAHRLRTMIDRGTRALTEKEPGIALVMFLRAREIAPADPVIKRGLQQAIDLRQSIEQQNLRGQLELAREAISRQEYNTATQLLRLLAQTHPRDETLRRLTLRARGLGSLTLRTPGRACEVMLRLVEGGQWRTLGQTPIEKRTIRAGLYQLRLQPRGWVNYDFPLLLKRLEDGHGEDRLLDFSLPERRGMALVPAGSYTCGGGPVSPRGTAQNQRETRFLPTYAIARREVTSGEYARFLGALPQTARQALYRPDSWSSNRPSADEARRPVVGINWQMARRYAMRAGLRLPSSHEWEKAGRGVDGRVYPWGNDPTRVARLGRRREPWKRPSPDVSPYGCENLSSGVAEWTHNPSWRTRNPDSQGLVRGGYWSAQKNVDGARIFRMDFIGSAPLKTIGFRCARGLLSTGENPVALLKDRLYSRRLAALRALDRLPDAVARGPLLEMIGDANELVAYRLLEQLRRRKISGYLSRIRALPEKTRLLHAIALSWLDQQAALPLLRALLNSRENTIKRDAAKTLIELGDHRGAVSMYELWATSKSRSRLQRDAQSHMNFVLSRIDLRVAWRKMLQHPVSGMRLLGITGLAQARDRSSLPMLRKLARGDASPRVRLTAAQALRLIR